jgi:hypothetical protein
MVLVHLKNETEVVANLKNQLEKHNGISFSDSEFDKVSEYLEQGFGIRKSQDPESKTTYSSGITEITCTSSLSIRPLVSEPVSGHPSGQQLKASTRTDMMSRCWLMDCHWCKSN